MWKNSSTWLAGPASHQLGEGETHPIWSTRSSPVVHTESCYVAPSFLLIKTMGLAHWLWDGQIIPCSNISFLVTCIATVPPALTSSGDNVCSPLPAGPSSECPSVPARTAP